MPQTQGGDSLENRPFQNNRGPRRGGFENRGGAFEGKGGAFEGKGEGPREGRGGGGGGGGFREGGRGGKREFERRSGSDKRLARGGPRVHEYICTRPQIVP